MRRGNKVALNHHRRDYPSRAGSFRLRLHRQIRVLIGQTEAGEPLAPHDIRFREQQRSAADRSKQDAPCIRVAHKLADCWVISEQCRALGAARNKDANVVFGLSVIDGLVNIEFAGRIEKTVNLDRFAPDRDHLDLETGPLQSNFREEVLLFLKTVGDKGGDFSFRRHVNPPASAAVPSTAWIEAGSGCTVCQIDTLDMRDLCDRYP